MRRRPASPLEMLSYEETAMKKTIIALRGVSNMGKTTTIRLAYEDLKQQFLCVSSGRSARKEIKGAILKINGLKIGFASSGDTPHILEKNLVPLIADGCVVIVCATHTSRSRTVDIVECLAAEHGFDVVWIEKDDKQTDHLRANQQKADEIITEIHQAIERAQPAEVE